MRLAILDDWFDTLRGLPVFPNSMGSMLTVFWTMNPILTGLAERLAPFDAITLFRERTAIPRALIERLPNLKLVSQRSVYPHVDVEACTDNGVLLCSNMHGGAPSFAAAEHSWALMLAAMRDIPAQMASLQSGNWQMGVGKSVHGRRIGIYGYGRIGKQVAHYAEAFGMEVVWWASQDGRARAAADGQAVAEAARPSFRQVMS